MGNIRPRYNAAPSQELLVIRQNHKTGERSLDLIKWGLIPYWCNDPRGGRKPINAKAERLNRIAMRKMGGKWSRAALASTNPKPKIVGMLKAMRTSRGFMAGRLSSRNPHCQPPSGEDGWGRPRIVLPDPPTVAAT